MSRRLKAESGQDLVEYALVLPLFLLLIISTIEFGLLFFQYSSIVNAAREGARAGIAMNTSTCDQACMTARVENAAKALLTDNFDQSQLQITTQWLQINDLPHVRVQVSYKTAFLTRTMIEAVGGSGEITLESTATMQREY